MYHGGAGGESSPARPSYTPEGDAKGRATARGLEDSDCRLSAARGTQDEQHRSQHGDVCVEDSAPEELAQPELSDDLLLEVFSWLPWRELLRGPCAVSRRWRELALRPCIWKFQNVVGDSEKKGARIAALRIAPCSRELDLNLVDWLMSSSLADAACHTSCGAAELWLSSHLKEDWVKYNAQAILRRQISLRRLKKVAFLFRHAEFVGEAIATALAAPLVELRVNIFAREHPDHGILPLEAPLELKSYWQESTLKVLSYSSCCPDPIVEDLITWHAGSLEQVSLSGQSQNRALELLSLCPRLRQLRVSDERTEVNFDPLADACPLLTDFSLSLNSEELVPSWLAFLRGAVQLTKISLQISIPDELFVSGRNDNGTTAALLLLAELGSSERSRLTDLDIRIATGRPVDAAFHHRLPAVLLDFPLLQCLTLHALPPASALNAITLSVAPSLRILNLRYNDWFFQACEFPDCRYPALLELVRRCPQLHVSTVPVRHECWDGWTTDQWGGRRRKPCSCCIGGIHVLVLAADSMWRCSLFGHSKQEPCELPAHRAQQGRGRCPSCFELCSCGHKWRYVGPVGRNPPVASCV